MIRHVLAAAALLAPVPVLAQSAQDDLDARYDRALAAGYKAQMLCSAIGNAERSSAIRTPASVEKWELAGIQAPLDGIVGDLPYRIEHFERSPGRLRYVAVEWAQDMPPRFAVLRPDRGCAALPIGANEPAPDPSTIVPPPLISIPLRTLDSPAVAEAVDGAFDATHGEGTRTTAVLVERQGHVWAERFADGFTAETPQRTWSVAKSIAATLIGAAVLRGDVEVGDSAGLGVDEADPRRAITIDNLLRMASGRYTDTPGNRTDPLYFGGATVEESATHWPLIHKPGTFYRYANNDTLMAVRAIKDTFADNPPDALLRKIGLYRSVLETDWQGDYVLSSQVWATAGDLMRLGRLYLNDGMWGKTRVLPEGWVDYVSSPSGPQPEGPFGYGAGFWLFNHSDGVPPDTFAMMGNRGQYVVIVPSRDVVIVRRGEDPVGARFDIAGFTRDVLAALEN